MSATCTHLDTIKYTEVPEQRVCEACLAIGSTWVHLRLCTTCGMIACCDDSPNRHMTAHFHAERGEDWFWCYVDEVAVLAD